MAGCRTTPREVILDRLTQTPVSVLRSTGGSKESPPMLLSFKCPSAKDWPSGWDRPPSDSDRERVSPGRQLCSNIAFSYNITHQIELRNAHAIEPVGRRGLTSGSALLSPTS